jgi:hypothetical protein
MNGHWWAAIWFVLSIAGFTAIMWILLGFAVHAKHRITIMLDTRYGWKDAGVLLMRKARQETGPPPGRHRAIEPLRPTFVKNPLPLPAGNGEPWPDEDDSTYYERHGDGPRNEHTVVLGDPLSVDEQPWPPPSPLRAIDDPANTVVLRAGDRHG